MTEERYNQLSNNDNLKLTDDELKEGWHFCDEWDGLLVSPEMPESKHCRCKDCE